MEGLVGYVANTVVLRTDLHGDPAFSSLLGRVKKTVLGALAHQDYPFALLVERLRPSRDLSYTPLVQVSFAWEQARRFQGGAADPEALELNTIHVGQGGAAFDLMIQVADVDGKFSCDLHYNADLFDAATIARMIGHFTTLLDGIVTDPARRLSQLPLLTESERRQQAAWNDTRVCYDAPDCLHDMVAETARRTPDAVALAFGNQEMTYAELDGRANALAAQLQRLGVGADGIVPVLLDRSTELVVALLGVLKAGGAFMPLDPAQPVSRIAAMIGNVPDAPVCVTHQRHSDKLWGSPVTACAWTCRRRRRHRTGSWRSTAAAGRSALPTSSTPPVPPGRRRVRSIPTPGSATACCGCRRPTSSRRLTGCCTRLR
ncbi:hypothetical protein NIIDMKKI_12270 [Mycobacterium kansasii]|uniref:Uncharacterized protein n=1 Tax=Mycobacterium kansasii TaxID=1768 RepID=A0A7G1I4W1_MYCKA|nr:hypothetical protein NIIDMKKI_12270 [Mycobacterium kansasii]